MVCVWLGESSNVVPLIGCRWEATFIVPEPCSWSTTIDSRYPSARPGVVNIGSFGSTATMVRPRRFGKRNSVPEPAPYVVPITAYSGWYNGSVESRY